MTMVILVFGGMAICDRRGGHVAVDLFEAYFPRWFNRGIDVISALTGAAIFVAMAWAVNDSAKISAMLNLQTNLLPLKKLWFQNALSILALVTALGMFLRALELAIAGRDVQKEAQV
jgi:TRAP-type C4-dicarboxylate transport system permease small subunit